MALASTELRGFRIPRAAFGFFYFLKNLAQLSHALGLDAAVLVCVWQRALAAGFGVQLDGSVTFILALSVALAYTADRWADIQHCKVPPQTWRHRFWRGRVSWKLWGIAFGINAGFALCTLSLRELSDAAFLLAAASFYLWKLARCLGPLPKALCTGLLHAWGICIFLPLELLELAPTLGLFALACAANCIFIAGHETQQDALMGQKALQPKYAFGLLCLLPSVGFVFAAFTQVAFYFAGYGLCLLLVFSRKARSTPSGIFADVLLLCAALIFWSNQSL